MRISGAFAAPRLKSIVAAAILLIAVQILSVAHAGSGYTDNGVDLDSIFAPWHTGWPQASATGIKVNGVDLNARYAPLSTGSAVSSATHYTVNGVDLTSIFAAYGSTAVRVSTQPSNVAGSTAAGYPSGTVTSGSTSTAGSKGGGSYTYTWHCTGCSVTSQSSASTTFYATVNAATTDNASAYCTISDSVTSVNTNTISVSLQNTTPATITVDATLIAGTDVTGTSPNQITYVGYSSPKSTGTFTVTSGSIPGSGAVWYLWTENNTNSTVFMIDGSSPAIGQNGLISVTVNGHTLTASGASSYTDNSGQEEWSWNSTNLGLSSGSSYPVVMTFIG